MQPAPCERRNKTHSQTLNAGAGLSAHLSHHYPREKADAAAAVGVRHHVAVADRQEGDRDHPQGLHVVAAQVPVVVMPVKQTRLSVTLC